MSTIRLLPTSLVNRIAAGEVIERPAAAVKELVENALDAGATRIAVSLTGGGIDRIEIVDDGAGMGPDDLALAVQRHCTSKLADGDLVRIRSLGFRGEALPSIGAAARLMIVSRPPDADHAHRIEVAGGLVSEVSPAAGAPGTRVVVEDLFYATPARRKFLKSPRTEADHAEACLRRLALAAPHAAFRLTIESRASFDLPPQDRAARAAALLGADAAHVLIPVEGQRDGAAVSGFAAAPSITRANTAGQSLVVNGRPVTDPILRTAIRVAYRNVIEPGRYPVVALWLDVPPEDLDVNVHPAKTELRFRAADNIRALVIGSVQRALGGGAAAAAARPVFSTAPLRLTSYPSPSPASGFAEAQLGLGGAPLARTMMGETVAAPSADHPLGAPVAQVLDTYIVAATADEAVVLVDQHAAHERLTHEKLRDQMMAGGVRTQALLLPAVIDLPPGDAGRLADAAPELARLGLELEAFGAGAVLVRALPAVLGPADPARLVRDIADELADCDESTTLETRLDAVIARMACHGSIRAGRRLSLAEMEAMLRQMEATPRAATCSHGRPTFLKLSKAEIEKMFGRR
jgi:DNA mismatch repair protein MutL